MESSQTFEAQTPPQHLNAGPFKGVMVGEADGNIERENNINISSQGNHPFALQVDGDQAPIAYRFVPLKVENAVNHLEEEEHDLPLESTIMPTNSVRLTLVTPQDNQVFVMDHGNANTLPRSSRSTSIAHKMTTAREEKRRVTHNEVERRRRDKINNWICKLAKILPDCAELQSKSNQSKGGILSKACDHIEELRVKNQQLSDRLGYVKEELNVDLRYQEVELLKKENSDLRNENALLKEKLKQHGLLTS